MAVGFLELLLIVAVAFVPAILYALWIRAAEIHLREPILAMLGVFIYGATVSVILAVILETIAVNIVGAVLTGTALSLALSVVIAPLTEELTKATGVFAVRGRLDEVENGLVYGAAVGLGFAATENVLYFTDALTAGTDIFLLTVIARTLTSTLLHASTSAIAGFGISRSGALVRYYGRAASWLPYYLAAVVIHAVFNLLASLGDIYEDQAGLLSLLGLVLGLILVWSTVRYVRGTIKRLDAQGERIHL